jgi:hypothetical protein
MAEENILLRVGIDQNQIKQSEQAIITARTEIDRLKEANKQLEKQGEKNSVQFVKNQTDIKDLSNEVRENERVLQANAKMSRSASGSISELRESVKTLQAEYVNLSKEERENEKVGGELQKRIKAQNDELKNLEKQIGVTGRNVGNYKEEIQSALAEAGLFNKAQAVMATVQNTVSAATKVATISTKSFGAALIATGIGAIVVVLGSLFAALTKTQEGMDFVSKATAAVGTFVSSVIDIFAELGKQLIDVIIPALIGYKDIWLGILTLDYDQVTKGIEGIGGAVSNIDASKILEIGANSVQAAKDAFQLQENIIALERAEARYGVTIAQNEAKINSLREASRDETLTFKEREDALKQAVQIENEQLEQSLMFAKQRLQIIKAQNSLTKSTEADLQKERDAEIAIAKLEAQSASNRIKLNKELKTIDNQRASEAKRLRDERVREEERVNREIAENEKKEQVESIARQKALNDQYKSNLEKKSKDTELFIRDTINGLKTQFAEGLIDLETYQKELNQVEALALETRRVALESQLAQNKENAEIDAETRLAIEQNLQNQLRAIEDQQLNASVKLQQEKIKLAEDEAKETERINKEKDDAIKASAEARAQAEIEAIQNVLGIAKLAFGESSAAGKIAASFQVLIDTFVGARRAFNSQLVPGDPTSPVRGAIAAAAVSAQGLAQVAKINSQPTPKYADGGGIEVSGASHASGGVDVSLGGQTVANVEGGEGLFVMKKDAYQSLKALSNYNQMFGGNSWFGGGKKFLADGGAISRGSTPSIDRRMLQDTQSSISNAMQSINVITKVTDINRVSNEMKIVEIQGDLR